MPKAVIRGAVRRPKALQISGKTDRIILLTRITKWRRVALLQMVLTSGRLAIHAEATSSLAQSQVGHSTFDLDVRVAQLTLESMARIVPAVTVVSFTSVPSRA